MDKSLLDTDILSEVLKGIDPSVVATAENYRLRFGKFTLSTITVVEIVKGLHKRVPDRVTDIVAQLAEEEVLPLGLEAATLASRIYADLEQAGQTIGRIDPLIAGVAIAHNLVLVTGNSAHFERVHALGYPLKLENWRVAG